MKRTSLVAKVTSVLNAHPVHRRWHDRVAPEHVATLAELKAAWKDGEFGTKRKRAARVISEILAAEGIAKIGTQGVDEWLAERS